MLQKAALEIHWVQCQWCIQNESGRLTERRFPKRNVNIPPAILACFLGGRRSTSLTRPSRIRRESSGSFWRMRSTMIRAESGVLSKRQISDPDQYWLESSFSRSCPTSGRISSHFVVVRMTFLTVLGRHSLWNMSMFSFAGPIRVWDISCR